jgi:hypothetical protein
VIRSAVQRLGHLPNDFVVDIERDILSTKPVTSNYVDDLKQALRDLVQMASEREQLETKIAKQKKRVAALYELVQTDSNASAIAGLVDGITDACRVVLRAAEAPLTAAQIRDRVQALGLPPQSNLLASVHTTLRRMKDAGEIAEHENAIGAFYVWQGFPRLNALSNIGREILESIPKTPAEAKQRLRPQERFSLSHTKGK